MYFDFLTTLKLTTAWVVSMFLGVFFIDLCFQTYLNLRRMSARILLRSRL